MSIQPLIDQLPFLFPLVPAGIYAVTVRVLHASVHGLFYALLVLPGTWLHELAHYLVAILFRAHPVWFSVWPRRQGNAWELGHVEVANLRWYNAWAVGMAPLALLWMPAGYLWWRHAVTVSAQDVLLAPVIGSALISFWPSLQDWRCTLRSWALSGVVIVWCVWRFRVAFPA